MALVKNWQFFHILLKYRQNSPAKCVSEYSRKKKSLSRLQKQQVKKLKKSKNWDFSKGVVTGFG